MKIHHSQRCFFSILLGLTIIALSCKCPKPEPPSQKERIFTFIPDKQGQLTIYDKEGFYKGGDILILKGTFTSVYISNLNGSATRPIVIKNAKGTVTTIGNSSWDGVDLSFGFHLVESHYIVLGGERSKSEFVLNGSKSANRHAYNNLVLSDHTDHIEIKNMIISNGGTGILAKTDPKKGDPSTHHPNSKLEELSIHDVMIDRTKNEAMYIGHTATYWNLTSGEPFYLDPSKFIPGKEYVQPIKWEKVKIYNNKVQNSGYDGIQTAAIDQLEVYNNTVINWATAHNSVHNGAILIGGRTTNTNTHDNVVHHGWGEMLQFYGSGENGAKHVIHNNLFNSNQSYDGISLNGIQNAAVEISNNTVALITGVAIRINGYLGMKAPIVIRRNALIQPRLNGLPIVLNAYIYIENDGIVIEGSGKDVNVKVPVLEQAKVDVNNFFQPLNGSILGESGYRKR
ncbi:hypothetical protein DBR43_09475 [Pedobacter sp. KBW06]|uniref:right-handed parallel beta-helix repeat-containing protein n=1 Tax=Pedobacter sp. KBW06 TaxID=2153359 RepID=UPI000F5B0C39|nr:right-handed parallel beta-helix repeat-containing protein [Pedobacter sp. KBW06]RQO75558.1 hypothetical protein DBR43_09475 [Pedobacter sp. KBW06]